MLCLLQVELTRSHLTYMRVLHTRDAVVTDDRGEYAHEYICAMTQVCAKFHCSARSTYMCTFLSACTYAYLHIETCTYTYTCVHRNLRIHQCVYICMHLLTTQASLFSSCATKAAQQQHTLMTLFRACNIPSVPQDT
jgi:hypothetical protein